MKTIKCLLVDDEPLALDALSTLVSRVPELEIAGKCLDAVEALQQINNREIDLVFLDINMPELSGLEMLRSLIHPPGVIFTTAYREYAADAFDLDVIDYLVKPISFERLLKAVNRYHERHGSRGQKDEKPAGFITLYSDKKNHKVLLDEIICVEGLKDYAMVHTPTGRLITRQTMKNMEEQLVGHEFLRVHRSWIIPIRKVSSWTGYSLNLGEREIPIGKTYRSKVLRKLES